MAARTWSAIDATIDNVISVAAVDGETGVVRTGEAIREAGWAQVPWVNGQWPPFDQVIAITLTRAQWEFALERMHEHAGIYAGLGDETSLELSRAAITVLSAALR